MNVIHLGSGEVVELISTEGGVYTVRFPIGNIINKYNLLQYRRLFVEVNGESYNKLIRLNFKDRELIEIILNSQH